MAESVATLVTAVKEEASFDVSDAVARAWLNRRYKQMVVRARALRYTTTLTSTADQRDYTLPSGLVEIDEVSVNGMVYGQGAHRDLANGALGYLVLGGVGGLVTSEESLDGDPEIALYPTPTEDGLEIAVRGIWEPSDLVADGDVSPVPVEFTDALIAGAIATGLRRQEHRPDLAQPHEQEFSDGCEEWRRQIARRYRGSGAVQIRVVGINA